MEINNIISGIKIFLPKGSVKSLFRIMNWIILNIRGIKKYKKINAFTKNTNSEPSLLNLVTLVLMVNKFNKDS